MITVEISKGRTVGDCPLEVVERKGIGHPDTICDSVTEAISVALSAWYLREFGTILHHNIDKGLLAAGEVSMRFGGGRMLRPMELTIGDRATFTAGGRSIPVADIAVATAKEWIGAHLRFVNAERHLRYRVALAPGSAELAGIFSRPGRTRSANDTSAAVGYYPLTPTEKAVLTLERHLNSREFKSRHPETGEDVKVMGLRQGGVLSVTVAMPLLAPQVRSEEEYFERKEILRTEMSGFLEGMEGFGRSSVSYNALDQKGRGLAGVYLSLLGTSAEHGDSGQVGRGNRVNGLIAMGRALGTEAAAGKNPVSHVGKIYNVLAHELAKEIYERLEELREVQVLLLSRIGFPIDKPEAVLLRLFLRRGAGVGDMEVRARRICEERLSRIHRFCLDLSRGKYPVC